MSRARTIALAGMRTGALVPRRGGEAVVRARSIALAGMRTGALAQRRGGEAVTGARSIALAGMRTGALAPRRGGEAVVRARAIALVAALVSALVACSTPRRTVPRAQGWQAFEAIAGVLQSPRCVSCHVPGDAPLQGDDGHRHVMNVKRGSDGRGTPALRCRTCHQDANTEAPHAPPGAPDWRLPPPATRMAWQGLAPAAVCAALTDPARNGGRDLAALEAHLRDDAIVGWAFHPGPGRRPPPLSRAELLARFTEWKDAGGPCAANEAP